MDSYDAGLLNDFGGGDVSWWQDYIRAELNRAEDFYREQYDRLTDDCNRYKAATDNLYNDNAALRAEVLNLREQLNH